MAFNDAQNTLMNPLASIANLLGGARTQTPDEQDRSSAQTMMMGQLGALLLAGGQRMTPQARAAIIASAAPVIGGYQKDVLSAAQARLMQSKATQDSQELERQNAIQEQLGNPEFVRGLGLTPQQAQLLGPQGAIDAMKARAAHDPMDIAYKQALIRKMTEGDARQWQVIGENEMGGKEYGYPPLPGEQPAAGAPQQMSIIDKIGDKRGQEALDIIKREMPALAPTVEGMAMGDTPYSPSLLKSKRGELIESLVRMVDPTYSPTTYDARKKALLDQQSNTSTSSGGIRKLSDTALRHFTNLYNNSDVLPQSELGPISSLKNQADLAMMRRSANIQDPNMQKLSAFENTLEIGGDEMAKALGIGSEGGREAIKHMFDPSQGRGVVREKIRNQIRLLKEKLDVQNENWNQTMGPAAGRLKIITPQMEEAFKLSAQRPMSAKQIEDANAAIQQGANRDEVIKHIIEQGYDPAGL